MKKYVVALEWETRTEYEKPGPISMMEYDPKTKKVLGMPKRFWRGGTDRGCIEAPHLTKRVDYYYIMCAEGGTGYYHSVTMMILMLPSSTSAIMRPALTRKPLWT